MYVQLYKELPNCFPDRSIELVMPSNHLILYCPLLLLPSIFPSIMIFFNESTLRNRWPKCWSFSFSISLSNKYSGLISFRIDWFVLLAIQKEISPGCSLEGLMLKLKLQYFGYLMPSTDSLEKTLMLGKIRDRRIRS